MSLYGKIIDLQKLESAWNRVRKNKPAAGVDNVSYDSFELDKKEELKKLNRELVEHCYECMPVRKTTIYQGEKARSIALYSMRDKVVQNSIEVELTRLYDARFSSSAIAYRPNKSALAALEQIEKVIKNGDYEYALKVDIKSFFDSIQWPKLAMILKRDIFEEDVINLIKANSVTPVLSEDGEIESLPIGVHQGSCIAPILSNIYLMEFDRKFGKSGVYYVRYSDDMLFLAERKDVLLDLFDNIKLELQELGLRINEKKSYCAKLEEGVDFLGHSFDLGGKRTPVKAKDNLNNRLEMMWLTSGLSIEEKIKKADEIVGGWKQYFRDNKEILSIFEFVILVGRAGGEEEQEKQLEEARWTLNNVYKDIAIYLSKHWKAKGKVCLELLEYEQFFAVPKQSSVKEEENTSGDVYVHELLEAYRKLIINEETEIVTEILQAYTDLGFFENASYWMDKLNSMKDRQDMPTTMELSLTEAGSKNLKNMSTSSTENMQNLVNSVMRLFAGREDLYAEESMVNGAKRTSLVQKLPLTEAEVEAHIRGERTIDTYIQRPNHTVRYIVIDVDVSKKILLQYERSTLEFQEYLKKAYLKAKEIEKIYRHYGMQGYIEFSGYRGFHVWLLFSEWIPVRYANMFCDHLESVLTQDEDITLEYFPNKTVVKADKFGQCIKLPLGKHIRTQEYSYFLDSDGSIVEDAGKFMDGIARFKLSSLKKVLAENSELKETVSRNLEFDLAVLGEQPASVLAVLGKCNLMKYLCKKACTTGYLTHFERLSFLYVFGHLGDEGKEFIHEVMGRTLNYQYNTTEKFIRKIPDKPISCVKLREQYKSLTAEYGCSCNFRRNKDCYPSPVLHAISLSTDVPDKITIPSSKSLSKENGKKVIEEMNIHTKAEELARKILDMKKQKRKIDANITKLENELAKIFDSEKTDILEIDIGMLTRRIRDGKYEWFIEI